MNLRLVAELRITSEMLPTKNPMVTWLSTCFKEYKQLSILNYGRQHYHFYVQNWQKISKYSYIYAVCYNPTISFSHTTLCAWKYLYRSKFWNVGIMIFIPLWGTRKNGVQTMSMLMCGPLSGVPWTQFPVSRIDHRQSTNIRIWIHKQVWIAEV